MIASPCTQVCQLDAATGVCRGCGRTLAEIARWSEAGEPERARIVDAARRRQEEAA